MTSSFFRLKDIPVGICHNCVVLLTMIIIMFINWQVNETSSFTQNVKM